MNLPALSLPKVELPFDVPVLMHPPVDHIMVAIPILILLIELISLVVKKRSITALSFFFVLIMVVAAFAAYYTGTIDGKEAYPLLSAEGKDELLEHKNFGTYLMLFSFVVLLFKLISMVSSKGIVKAFYLLILAVFVASVLKQGKDGGELVYEFGANVEAVQMIKDDMADIQDELDDATEELESKSEALEEAQAKIEELTTAAPSEDQNTTASEDQNTTAEEEAE
jgi:uncharacterized membrane protein